MAASFDTHCLFSTLRNSSGTRKIFGFLPPHGRELGANQEFTIFGDVLDLIAHRNGDRVTSRRHIQAFEQAINRGDLIIVQTPSPILQDTVTGTSRMLQLTSNVLGVVDPCWANPGSVVPDLEGGNQFDG